MRNGTDKAMSARLLTWWHCFPLCFKSTSNCEISVLSIDRITSKVLRIFSKGHFTCGERTEVQFHAAALISLRASTQNKPGFMAWRLKRIPGLADVVRHS